uniref:Helicase n=1 Tax=viral metagenome TaxID=1070528 RepID=A0A6C0IJQ1_9ZZZZ
MVKACLGTYPETNETIYKSHFEKYSFPLSNFQKYAIEGIIKGGHALVCAPTGSGKTLVADFAIDYFVSLGKKVIYTSPIKALSNQKFYEFTQKYPHITFGILTGDIKTNPEADVLIMTSEILLNQMYYNKSLNKSSNTNISFNIDIDKDVGCVIMDEVHYINDKDRGHVWEETIMMLPSQIQMVMLSATLDAPEKFALWCETRNNEHKEVYLATETIRNVPLTHYSFITTNNGIFKAIKDKSKQDEIKSLTNKPFIIQDSKGVFNETHYFKMTKMLKLFSDNNVYVNRQHTLNQITKYMVDNTMLPALCFVLSRKTIEICAKEVTTVLLEDDSKVPYIIQKECEQILRKLPNYKEYLELPEYINMISLLEKGIAIHHAGVMPILREMVELLYAKGYIKLLFATETFSIGLNMPTKTVIFTDIHKYDGHISRFFHSHEYTQMAGRAGRRGIDTVGHVIHLNNIFKNMDLINYKIMMKGTPQVLVSKFKISYNLLLNLIDLNENTSQHDLFIINFTKKSMIQQDIDNNLKEIQTQLNSVKIELDKFEEVIQTLNTPTPIINEYLSLTVSLPNLINKKKRESERKIQKIQSEYKFIDNDKITIQKYNDKKQKYSDLSEDIQTQQYIIYRQFKFIIDFLIQQGFIQQDYKLSNKGFIASQIKELHCLTFSNLILENKISILSPKQLVIVFSCFTNILVCEELKTYTPYSTDKDILKIITEINNTYNFYIDTESTNQINTGCDYNIHFDLLQYVDKWCDCENIQDCKLFIQILKKEKDISIGDFVKALLKINNISSEMEKIAEHNNDMFFLQNLKEIPNITLKYIATNQSLYI